MKDRYQDFESYALQIHDVLDKLDYYQILGVDRDANVKDIKEAFYPIAAKFHPDHDKNASPKLKLALSKIFMRLNEGFRVLCDEHRRAMYDQCLEEGKVRLVNLDRRSLTPTAPQDTIRSRSARSFYLQAEEELKKGNLGKAELHLKMGLNLAPESETLRKMLADLGLEQKKQGQSPSGDDSGLLLVGSSPDGSIQRSIRVKRDGSNFRFLIPPAGVERDKYSGGLEIVIDSADAKALAKLLSGLDNR